MSALAAAILNRDHSMGLSEFIRFDIMTNLSIHFFLYILDKDIHIGIIANLTSF